MHSITLHQSRILIGESHRNFEQYLPQQQVIVVIDETVCALYTDNLWTNYQCIKMLQGEQNKTLATVHKLTQELIALRADRNTFILGIGGGITCDVVGFLASIFMRGCNFGFISTTLLSQVDASVGGKNGVNMDGYKNMLGVFAQPQFVLCDTSMLKSLPHKEFTGGFAEIIKAAIISNQDLFYYLKENTAAALNKDIDVLNHLIHQAVLIKANIVMLDEQENGVRRLLNLGHTFAHAIEKLSAYTHGESVAIGLCLASELSYQLGIMKANDLQEINGLLKALLLPTQSPITPIELFEIMTADKKKNGDNIHLILPEKIGKCRIEKVSLKQFKLWCKNL
ncbi:MAG: 3-dehydroquinate synthase [Bacteroidales bacterium]